MKEPGDPLWENDPAYKEWLDFMDRYFPDGDKNNTLSVYGYSVAQTLVQVLKQCGDRPHPRERDEASGEPQGPPARNAAAGHRHQHQCDRLRADRADADDAVFRRALGAVRFGAERHRSGRGQRRPAGDLPLRNGESRDRRSAQRQYGDDDDRERSAAPTSNSAPISLRCSTMATISGCCRSSAAGRCRALPISCSCKASTSASSAPTRSITSRRRATPATSRKQFNLHRQALQRRNARSRREDDRQARRSRRQDGRGRLGEWRHVRDRHHHLRAAQYQTALSLHRAAGGARRS